MLNMKKKLTALALTGAAVAAVSATLSAPQASATNVVDCGDRTDLVKVWYHDANGDHYVSCFANAGWVEWGYWTDQVSTGNNAISVHDADGDAFTLNKWTVYNPVESFDMADFTVL